MKKLIKNLLSASAILLSLIFTSCYDAVFFEIEQDVEPETATVSGPINSITRYTVDSTEFLVLAADDGIRYKQKDNQIHDSWKIYESLPFDFHSYDYYSAEHNGQQIIKVLADSTNLYIVTASYEDNEDLGTIGAKQIFVWTNTFSLNEDGSWKQAGEWTCVINDENNKYFPFYYYGNYKYSAFSIFQTNAPLKENRKVFIRSGNVNASSEDVRKVSYYQISGKTVSEVDISPADSDSVNNISSAVVLNGDVIFFNSLASTTNETYTTPATRIYYGDKEDLYYSKEDGSTEFVFAFDAGDDISSLATTQDSLLIGRANYSSTSTTAYGGIVKTSLKDGVPGSGLISFNTNAEFQLSSSYFIDFLLNATPEKPELESALYAAISFFGTGVSSNVSYDNVGLWSYYPERGNWNRE